MLKNKKKLGWTLAIILGLINYYVAHKLAESLNNSFKSKKLSSKSKLNT
jgi:hypothetical protein